MIPLIYLKYNIKTICKQTIINYYAMIHNRKIIICLIITNHLSDINFEINPLKKTTQLKLN